MSLNKAIEHKKEHRKQYEKICEQVDPTCRPHGGCDWCYANRHYRANKEKEKCDLEEKMYDEGI